MKKLLIILLVCLFITGCSSNKTKEAKTLEDFKNVATENGFMVDDNNFAYSNATYIEGAMMANLDDIDFEMIIYSNADYANQVQEQHIKSFATLRHTGAFIEKEKGANYYKYALISNNRYMVSIRVDNTLLFTKVMIDDKGKIDSVINGLGY